ncbi:MAG: carboxypeptidase M32, partial [Bacteroidota bacterium]
SAFAPHLETVVQLSRDKADALGYAGERYDALLDLYEPGMTATELDVVFADLREGLVPLVDELASRDLPDEVLHRPYDPQAQWAFGLEVIEAFGYDFERGRQDESAHPFTTTFHVSDVRITTRVDPHFFSPAFFGTLHEAGHGMYEQGVDLSLARTPLADGTSLGMHESQSRLWENLVGRSRPFWRRYFPVVQRHFPEALAGVDEDTFYQAVNRVAPSLIRVEADEVTYNLHIMLRFALERALVAGDLSVRDLPVAWNDRMKSDLGIVPPSDADGCLQDIHWSMGLIGYFPTYSLGNLMSVQLFEAAERDLGDLGRHIEHGQFAPLLGWLRSNVHQFGRSKSASEILHDATGSTLSATPWLNYIETKLV